MNVLVVNAGSSSLKLRLLDGDDELVWQRDLTPDEDLGDLGSPDAVGHRIVHGGTRYVEPVVVDERVEAGLRALTELAPLHQPASLAALDAVTEALPGVPAVACFDTAFHATMPAAAATYALPERWRELRRYGFHGLSHAYASRRADARRVVVCHLGAGASLCAVRDGRSVDTTMGFTPLEGLVMATRSGSVDPGLLLWLAEREPLDAIAHALEHESGLLGLAGTADMREVLASEDTLALDVYVHRLVAGIAAMVASLGGLDALVFTGGVGEHAPAIRERAVAGLGFLGVELDADANAQATTDADITGAGSSAHVLVVTAREDLEIARGVRSVISVDKSL